MKKQPPLHVAGMISTQKSVSVCGESFAILGITRLMAGKIRHNRSTKSWKRQEDWEVKSWLLENDNNNINLMLSSWVLGSSWVP